MIETVKLIHCTLNAEQLIVKMARVSNPKNQENWDTGPKLLRYLIKHKHWSPFEMASMCVEIQTERDIAAQILRHRSFSFQEFSQRYAKAVPAECPYMRLQDNKNRQNSLDEIEEHMQAYWADKSARVIMQSYALYEEMLQEGVAKETARRILPLCTPTTMYMHGTLRSWLHYIQVRTDPGTQEEHREIALQCKKIFARQFPVIAEAAFEDGYCA
jgi:thymidylate synthase (FAD)